MPRGLAKVAQLAADAQKRQQEYEQGEGNFQRALVLQENQTARGRFLEEGEFITYLYTHELPKKPGQRFGDRVLCLDQALTAEAQATYVEGSTPCKGCELENVSRTPRVVINFIRYDEPKLRRGPDNKPVKDQMGNYIFDGVEPQLVVWNAPQSVGGRLSFLESQHGGLTNHVVTIHRTTDNKNPWMIDVVEKNVAPQEFERKLFSEKVEPEKAIRLLGKRSIPLMSYGDMARAYGIGGFAEGATTPQPGQQPVDPNNIYAQAAQQAGGGQAGHLNLGAFNS